MAFDPCTHLVKTIIVAAGREIRKAKGLPEEKNITALYEEASQILGILPIYSGTSDTGKLPSPYEMGQMATQAMAGRPKEPVTPSAYANAKMAEATKMLLKNKKICPKCGKQSMELTGICGSCKDAEGGKYKTAWRCVGIRDESGKMIEQGCGEMIKSEKFMAQWFSEFGIVLSGRGATKQELGIGTLTDEGIK